MLTMTETWMGGRQTQKDHDNNNNTNDLYGSGGGSSSGVGADHHHNSLIRSSLGQLIERSISAPPSSDSYDDSSHTRFMHGTMWSADESSMPGTTASTVVSAYDSQPTTPIVQNGRGIDGTGLDDHPFGGALLIHETMDKSGRATAPSTCWDGGTAEILLNNNSGRRSAEPPSSLRFEEEDDSYLTGGSLLASSLGLGMQRSHSAAPSFAPARSSSPGVGNQHHHHQHSNNNNNSNNNLGPPPGLTRLMGEQIQRPASAGMLDSPSYKHPRGGSNVVMGGSAQGLSRPAAKTLMDLIQEDIPAEETDVVGVGAQPTGMRHAQLLPHQHQQQQQSFQQQQQPPYYMNHNGQPNLLHQQQQLHQKQQQQFLQNPLAHHQQQQQQSIRSPYELDPSSAAAYNMVPQQQQQQSQQQHQLQMLNGNLDGLNYGMQNMSIKNTGGGGGQMFADRSGAAHLQPQQRYVSTPMFDGGGIDDPYGSGSPAPPQIRQVQPTLQLRSPQQQQRLGMPQDAEHLYYSQQPQAQRAPQEQQQQQQQQQLVDIQAPRLQPQILPNGQTVYVQTSPQASQGMGFSAPMPFNAAAAATANPSAQLYQRSDGQYVSVVPVHAPPAGNMAFWQTDGNTGQAVLMSGSAGGVLAPTAVPHGLMSPRDQQVSPSPHGGRHQKNSGGGGGGRNRRNERSTGRRNESKDRTAPLASPILEEFRSNKNRQWTIAHIEGHVVEFCQDQNGSRFIQQRLEMGDLMEQAIVIREVLPTIRRLRNDVFGNYVVQKLLDFGTPQVRADIRDTLEGEMMQLSLQMYGCRVVQKALETLPEEDLSRLLHEFHHNVLSCIYDQNGNHVIQKCVEVLSTRSKRALAQGDGEYSRQLRAQIDFIVTDVLVNAASLSCHPYGCRVLQRILEHCDEETKHKILDEVKSSHKRLLDDQYGNYVIQHVLQFGRTSDRDSILQIVASTGLLGLSRQKFASNVVEKLLKYGNSNHRRAIAAEMLKKSHDMSIENQSPEGTSIVLLMVRDAYANYVVQTTLDVVPESDEKLMLLRELKAHSDELKNYTFAKHIVSKLATLTV